MPQIPDQRLARGLAAGQSGRWPRHSPECVPPLLELIAQGKVKLFARHAFPLAEVRQAFEALASRNTLGKIVLVPESAHQMHVRQQSGTERMA